MEKNIYKERSKEKYNKIADKYSISHDGKFVEPMYDEVINRIRELNPKSILDVGCGTGIVLSYFKDKGIELYGLDISEKMIEEARRNLGEGVQLKVGDSESMPWEDNSFDIILCNASFHHYPNPKTALSEMNRLLKPNGTLIIGDPAAPVIIRQLINGCLKYSDGGDFKIYNRREIEKLLEETGFKPYNYKKINYRSFIINASH